MRNSWTKEEDAIIKAWYDQHVDTGLGTHKISNMILESQLPGRTKSQINNRAVILGYSKPRFNWTDEKLELLRQLYPEQGAKCANLIGCSSTACAQMANKLGIKFNKPEAKPKTERVRFAWTDEEDDIIRTVYPGSIDDCVAKLPIRNRASIIARAKKLGVAYGGAERVIRCVELNISYTLSEASARFNKTKGAFIHACKVGGYCAGYHWEYLD
jgi:hypothetical protein